MSVILPRRFQGITCPLIENYVYSNNFLKISNSGRTQSLYVDPTGKHMHVGYRSDNLTTYREFATGFDPSSTVLASGNWSPPVAKGTLDIWGIFLKSDGTQVWLSGDNGVAVRRISSYTVNPAWYTNGANPPNTPPVFVAEYNYSSDTSSSDLHSIQMNREGTVIIGLANDGIFKALYQWDLSTAWDLTTISHNANSPARLPNSGLDYSYVAENGLCVFAIDGADQTIRQYAMTTPWDISTFDDTELSQLDVGARDINPRGFYVNSTRMILLTGNSVSGDGSLYQYNLA